MLALAGCSDSGFESGQNDSWESQRAIAQIKERNISSQYTLRYEQEHPDSAQMINDYNNCVHEADHSAVDCSGHVTEGKDDPDTLLSYLDRLKQHIDRQLGNP